MESDSKESIMAAKKAKQTKVVEDTALAEDPAPETSEPQATVQEPPTEENQTQDQPLNSATVERARKLATSLWQASLGIVVTLEHRGIKWFNRLVEKGARLQYQANSKADQEPAEQAQATTSARLRAVDRIHDLEHSIEHGLEKGRDKSLHWIGVPSRDDFEALTKQVEDLTNRVEQMETMHRQESYADAHIKANKTVIA